MEGKKTHKHTITVVEAINNGKHIYSDEIKKGKCRIDSNP